MKPDQTVHRSSLIWVHIACNIIYQNTSTDDIRQRILVMNGGKRANTVKGILG